MREASLVTLTLIYSEKSYEKGLLVGFGFTERSPLLNAKREKIQSHLVISSINLYASVFVLEDRSNLVLQMSDSTSIMRFCGRKTYKMTHFRTLMALLFLNAFFLSSTL